MTGIDRLRECPSNRSPREILRTLSRPFRTVTEYLSLNCLGSRVDRVTGRPGPAARREGFLMPGVQEERSVPLPKAGVQAPAAEAWLY